MPSKERNGETAKRRIGDPQPPLPHLGDEKRMRTCLRFAVSLSLCSLCLCGHFSSAKAATPREELLRLVPEDVGFCLVIQDLRGHSERCLSSPFVKELRDSPIGQTIRQAPETRKLAEFDRHIQQVLGVSLAQLRDDICGDAVILAYRPGHPGKEEQEEGLLLVRARDARVRSEE